MMQQTTEAPRSHIKSEIVATGPHSKIVRMTLPEGEALPTHPAKARVLIAVVAGEGRIDVAGREMAVEPGRVVEVALGEPHAVFADQALELLIVQLAPQ